MGTKMHHTERMQLIFLLIVAVFANLASSKVKQEDDYYNSNEYVIDEGGGGGGSIGNVNQNIATFEKCCREGQILDLATMQCLWTRAHKEAVVPTFASEYVFYEHMGIESPKTPELPEFQLKYKKDQGLLDTCDRAREDLGYRLKKNNDIRDVDSLYDNYIIDDLNFTGKLYQLVDMTDKRVSEELWTHLL